MRGAHGKGFCSLLFSPLGELTPTGPFGLEGESVAECGQEPGVHHSAGGQAAAEGAPARRRLRGRLPVRGQLCQQER